MTRSPDGSILYADSEPSPGPSGPGFDATTDPSMERQSIPMSAWDATLEQVNLRRRFDDDEDFEDDGFILDEEEEEDEDAEDEDDELYDEDEDDLLEDDLDLAEDVGLDEDVDR